MSRLDAEEERDLAAYLAQIGDPDDPHARRDAEITEEIDRLLREHP